MINLLCELGLQSQQMEEGGEVSFAIKSNY